MSEEQLEAAESVEAVATIGRNPGTVYVLPHTSESIPEFLNPALGRIDPESPAVQVLILTSDGENALAIAEMAHSLNGATGIEVLPATSASRSARQLKSRPVRAVAGTPEELLSLVSGTHLKLDDLKTVVIAWAEDLLEQGEKSVAALESILSEAGKTAERVIVTRKLDKRIEDFVERYARRARRAPMPMDDIGSGEIPEIKYLTTAGIAKPGALRKLLDELDPPSAAIVVRTEKGEKEARRVLRALGYQESDPAFYLIRGAPTAHVHTIILYDSPVRRSEIHALGGAEAVNLVVLVQPSEMAPLREMMGAKLGPLNLTLGASKLRRRDDAIRSELRSILSAGVPPREIAPLEPLLAEYDAVEIAAAALQLLERERRIAKAPASSGPTAPAAAVPSATPGWTGAMSKLFVTLGERDGLKAGDLVGTIAGEAGIPGGQIGKVEVYESHTIVEVPAAESERIIGVLNGKMIKGRKVAVRADRPKSERKSSEGDSRGGDRPPRRTFERDDRPRAPPAGAGGDRPRSGSDRPRSGSDRPRPGSDRPRPGSDRPRFGSDRSRSGSDRPRPGSDRPRSGPRSSAPPRKGRPER